MSTHRVAILNRYKPGTPEDEGLKKLGFKYCTKDRRYEKTMGKNSCNRNEIVKYVEEHKLDVLDENNVLNEKPAPRKVDPNQPTFF